MIPCYSAEGDKSDREIEDMELYDVPFEKKTTPEDKCNCSDKNSPDESEVSIFLKTSHYPLCDLNAQTKFGFDKCKKFVYKPITEMEEAYYASGQQIRNSQGTGKSTRSPGMGAPLSLNVTANYTKYELTGLKPYSTYVFYISACNKADKCGPVRQEFSRTKKKTDADNVDPIDVNVSHNGVTIKWIEPTSPNSMILSFNIEYNKIDVEHSKPMTECLSRNKRHVSNKLTLANLQPGEYSTRVQAVSLAGPGKFSEYKAFTVDAPAGDVKWVVPVIK
ncbi:hypothetical protein NQ318_011853 [Aromia moschata]|uniref:Fibronectin type-III domain-containing protein n=1 Tax=Aromia moschata TaxID=1265417 RepID=A0AAV8XP60_9CUCU|nr:hypothetical protein NQ318_011853 [Aromia moschata]